jgi:hypothetical protein
VTPPKHDNRLGLYESTMHHTSYFKFKCYLNKLVITHEVFFFLKQMERFIQLPGEQRIYNPARSGQGKTKSNVSGVKINTRARELPSQPTINHTCNNFVLAPPRLELPFPSIPILNTSILLFMSFLPRHPTIID